LIGTIIAKIFGTRNERYVKKLLPMVERINALELEYQNYTDEQLRSKTLAFKERIQKRLQIELPPEVLALVVNGQLKRQVATSAETEPESNQTNVALSLTSRTDEYKRALQDALDEVLPEAFAAVREAGKRILGMRHYDVQLIGGMVLHRGMIAEMKTGEGKTLVATLPVYLNALAGLGVHVVTVNDYLAKRDAEWMGKLYEFLGMNTGVIVHDLDDEARRAAYAADITYGTNNEFGFDYLRDNMKFEFSTRVQRGHHFAIVDEVDSILIDEARTPLIISGSGEESTDKYARVDRIIPKLTRGEEKGFAEEKILTGDYVVDEKHRNIVVTDEGWEKIEKLLGIDNIAAPENWDLKHHAETAIKAHTLYKHDVHYMVKDGEVIIVDEFTGRLMPGRRWSDGLHQAVEAKEGVKIEQESLTLATVTFQNYFRMFNKLAGMTGTAETEAAEFDKIYKLDVIVIPTNSVMVRIEHPDIVYRTEREKYFAAADEVMELSKVQRPVLVGTTSIEKSERLSELLKKKGVEHVVLNAKYHEKEAEIVAQAGRKGAVTIATNMAGRGTDILLGGNAEFITKQELVKKGTARKIENVGGELNVTAAEHTHMRFYYNGAEYEVETAKWEETIANNKTITDQEHKEVIALGGLHILGTERHEARRIDNQLRGRAGRQGDPGSSRFYLALEDDLMRIFAKEWISNWLEKLGMEEGVPIESGIISRRIEGAQKAVESQNFAARKHLLEYDDVMNKQRLAVYGLRDQLLEGMDQKELIVEDYAASMLGELLDQYVPTNVHPEQWDLKSLVLNVQARFTVDIASDLSQMEKMTRAELGDHVFDTLRKYYDKKEAAFTADALRYHERMIMLNVIDTKWKDHLQNMEHLKEGINLRAYGQKDPLVEYKRESFEMFEEMMASFQEETVRFLFSLQYGPVATAQEQTGSTEGKEPMLQKQSSIEDMEREFQRRKRRELEQAKMAGGGVQEKPQTVRRSGEKIRPNDPCHCGSGKKFKKCHGAEA